MTKSTYLAAAAALALMGGGLAALAAGVPLPSLAAAGVLLVAALGAAGWGGYTAGSAKAKAKAEEELNKIKAVLHRIYIVLGRIYGTPAATTPTSPEEVESFLLRQEGASKGAVDGVVSADIAYAMFRGQTLESCRDALVTIVRGNVDMVGALTKQRDLARNEVERLLAELKKRSELVAEAHASVTNQAIATTSVANTSAEAQNAIATAFPGDVGKDAEIARLKAEVARLEGELAGRKAKGESNGAMVDRAFGLATAAVSARGGQNNGGGNNRRPNNQGGGNNNQNP